MTKYRSEGRGRRNFDTVLHYNTVDMIATEKTHVNHINPEPAAGGALGGVIGAALRVLPHFKEEWIQTPFYAHDAVSQSVSALLFVGLCLYVWFSSQRKISAGEE